IDECNELVKQKVGIGWYEDSKKLQASMSELDGKMSVCTQQLEGVDNTLTQFIEHTEPLHNQIALIEKELGELQVTANTGAPVVETFSQDLSGLTDLYNKIQIIQGDMENLNQTTTRLMDDREERKLHIGALLEQIEVLKNIKADREDLEEALADKADDITVNRKVSQDQFDAVCDDLSRGLEEAQGKLTLQEGEWHQKLSDLQKDIESKLDKIEITPLKDFVNSKLKALQERFESSCKHAQRI
ncbi:hypothetical protein L9F63_021978, partial [Diploptera punctata]